jgi:hypothetical protein
MSPARRSRGMGSVVVLALGLIAAYGAISAMALSSFDVGAVLSFPGRLLDSASTVALQPVGSDQQYHRSGGGRAPSSSPAVQRPAVTPKPVAQLASLPVGAATGATSGPGGPPASVTGRPGGSTSGGTSAAGGGTKSHGSGGGAAGGAGSGSSGGGGDEGSGQTARKTPHHHQDNRCTQHSDGHDNRCTAHAESGATNHSAPSASHAGAKSSHAGGKSRGHAAHTGGGRTHGRHATGKHDKHKPAHG